MYGFAVYGWSFYATWTDRPGLWGSAYIYYNLSKEAYCFYTLLMTLLSLSFLVLPSYFIVKGESGKLNRVYRYFLVFIAFAIAIEVALFFRFTPKG